MDGCRYPTQCAGGRNASSTTTLCTSNRRAKRTFGKHRSPKCRRATLCVSLRSKKARGSVSFQESSDGALPARATWNVRPACTVGARRGVRRSQANTHYDSRMPCSIAAIRQPDCFHAQACRQPSCANEDDPVGHTMKFGIGQTKGRVRAHAHGVAHGTLTHGIRMRQRRRPRGISMSRS